MINNNESVKNEWMRKRLILIVGVAIAMLALFATSAFSQSESATKVKSMKFNSGIITPLLKESKAFYVRTFGFGVTFENEFYVLMHTPNHQAEISFLLPDHPSQQPLFHPAFPHAGVYFTIEVEDVEAEYKRIKALGVPIAIELRDEPWGDRHFAIADPNGIGIDVVTYQKK
jgi:catechol 2,3-dioxygenase-like lactoylglutathione lyase family enzyme